MTWPALLVPRDAFERYLEERLAAPASDPASLNVEDLYLACACVLRAPRALEEFDGRYAGLVARSIEGIRLDSASAEDVRQLLWSKLFVDSGRGTPRIAEYRGRGSLSSWVRAAAIRTALDLRGGAVARATTLDDGAEALALVKSSPELEPFKDSFRTQLQGALEKALARRSDHEATLLRLHIVEGMSFEQLGRLHGVNKSTACRWVARLRGQLLSDVRAALSGVLDLNTQELRSAINLVKSELHLSVPRLLDRGAPSASERSAE